MRPILSSLFAVLVGVLVGSACYAERQPPPSFRYTCDGDRDCLEGQSCIDGLCETPCTQENFEEVCVRGEVYCLNGVCSSTCEIGGSGCPAAQECLGVEGIDLSGGGGGGFFGGGGNSDVDLGLCLRRCSEGTCADSDVCVEGVCLRTCLVDIDCQAGFVCTMAVCLPDFGGTTSFDPPTTATDATATDTTVGPPVTDTLDSATAEGGGGT